MRATTVVLAALILLGRPGPLRAQDAPAPDRAAIQRALDELRRDIPDLSVPEAGAVTQGSRLVAAAETAAGPIATWGGDLEIRGLVTGDAVAVDGDVIVAPGGRVEGNVVSVRGETRISGTVGGLVARLDGSLAPPPVAGQAARSPGAWHSVGVTLATFAIFLLLGIGVLIFAGPTLETVADALERSFRRSFLVGIAGQLGVVPGLFLLIVALVLTAIGVLLIPFAIVAYVLALSGAATLAFLTVALVIGEAAARRRSSARLTRRAEALRGMILGIVALFLPWILAAFLEWVPLAAAIVRIVAVVVTWVAVTAGFGAVLISRAGTRRAEPVAERPPVADDFAWQTPTPVSGVAAARRPTPVASHGGSR